MNFEIVNWIKQYRATYGCSLKAAKEAWDTHRDMKQGPGAESVEDRICRLNREREQAIHRCNLLLSAMIEARESLQFANDNPGGGISDTIWMMHRNETLFDFMDSAIEKAKGVAARLTSPGANRPQHLAVGFIERGEA